MAGVRLKVQILLHEFSFWEDFFFFFFGASPEHRTDEAACISEEQRCRRHDMVPAMFDEIESLGFFSFVLAALYKLLHYASQTDHNAKVVLKQSKKKNTKKTKQSNTVAQSQKRQSQPRSSSCHHSCGRLSRTFSLQISSLLLCHRLGFIPPRCQNRD